MKNQTHQPELKSEKVQQEEKLPWDKKIQNIIYAMYLLQNKSDNKSKLVQQDKKQMIVFPSVWHEFKRQFKYNQVQAVMNLYTSQKIIGHVIHYLMSLPLIQNSKKIIKNIVQYYDPSRQFIKSMIQTLVPNLQNYNQSELNRISVILFTLNVLFAQQSPQNPKFNSYIYLNGGEGIKLQQKIKWPFQKSGTICLWYNMSDQTKQCKLFQIVNAQKSGFQIVVRNKKIYFQRLKQQKGFSLMRNDSAFLCQAQTNTDIKLWVEFETKKRIFQKALFLNVVMNNFVLNNIEVDLLAPSISQYSISLFKNFTVNQMIHRMETLNSKQVFLYQSDIRNFSHMYEKQLGSVLFLFTAIRSHTFDNQNITKQINEGQIQQKNKIKTVLYDAINHKKGIIEVDGCVYRNISIHKKQISLYGGLETYIGFFQILKLHKDNLNEQSYNFCLGELIILFKNIFQSKTTSIVIFQQQQQQSQNINFFRIMSNFFVETEMAGYNQEISPKIKQLYVSLNNRIIKQKFIKKFIWGIPAGIYLSLSKLQNFLNLVKGFYIQQIQNSLQIFNVKDIIMFLLDNYDKMNCCFDHYQSSSIDNKRKINNYKGVLFQYFKIIQIIVEIKQYDADLSLIISQIISAFSTNCSPCFLEALSIFILKLLSKDTTLQNSFLQHFQKNQSSKMSLFVALANTSSWKTKSKLVQLLLKLFGNKLIKQANQRDLLSLCIRYSTLTVRFSSIKSQDIDRSVDVSQDKLSFNSTNIRTIMAMKPLSFQSIDQMVLINDIQILQIIWKWGQAQYPNISHQQCDNNPSILIITDLYKGSNYSLRMKIAQKLNNNKNSIQFTPELMAWVIQCLLLCQYDSQTSSSHDQIQFKYIQNTKNNLLQLISSYRRNDREQEQSFQVELDIINLILISVKSKYSQQISQLYHVVFLRIASSLIQNLYQQFKNKQFHTQQIFTQSINIVVLNSHKCLLQYFAVRNNEDLQFQDQSQMQQNMKQYSLLLSIIQKIFDILLFLATPGSSILMEQANAKRNQVIFQILFPQESNQAQVSLTCFIFVCLQGIFDNYDDSQNISQKKLTLTLIKKFLIFLIQISQNSGQVKLQKHEQQLKNIFINALGFIQNKYYQYYFMDGEMERTIFKSAEQLKNQLLNIFLQLILLVKYIQQSSCATHKSFYQLMKPKKKHKNIVHIKNFFPTFWKSIDDKILQFISLSNQILKGQQIRDRLQQHLKMKRLYSCTIIIQKKISKTIDKLLQIYKKANSAIQKNSVYSYQRNQGQKCKIITQFQQTIAVFMFQNANKIIADNQNRKIQVEVVTRQVKFQQTKIWNYNRTFQGFWANSSFYSFAQNQLGQFYNNDLNKFYKRERSERSTSFFLMPFIQVKALPKLNEFYVQQQIYLVQQNEDEGQKPSQRRKSQKYLQVGFQFIKKKVIQKIKKSPLMRQRLEISNQSQKKIQQIFFKQVLLVQVMKVRQGTLKIDNHYIQFQFKQSNNLSHISLLKNKQKNTDLLSQKWQISYFQTFQLKRYLLKPNSVQLYFKNRNPVFLSFYGKSQQSFNKFIQILMKIKKQFIYQKINPILKIIDSSKHQDKFLITQMWKNREISNLQYLMGLNILSGRSNNDLNQYPVFPWILADYSCMKNRKQPIKHRDLQKNMGSLGSNERIQKFIEIKNNIQQNHKQQFLQSHFFGFHYSNLPIVLQYLIRTNPYAEGAMQLQGGKFDIPDRLFTSISDSFRNATTEMSDVRQLIPQFFYFPQFLLNSQDFDFGIQQNKKRVYNVQLPQGCLNAYDFIQAHRQILQSEQVSMNLHKWIDLVFGYKQYGKQAELNFNKFHYLAYQNNSSIIFTQERGQNRDSIESQMAYYGKVPSQIFTKPHPKRNSINNTPPLQYTQGYTRANLFIGINSISENIQNCLIKHEKGVFSLQNQACIHFRYCEINKKYILLRRDGKGVVFQNQRNDYTREMAHQKYLSITNSYHFQLFLDKYQNQYIFDQTRFWNSIPICSLWSQHIFVGGLWGGKIMKYDPLCKQQQAHSKHSDTVCALEGSEQLSILISGSVNGQIVIWQYLSKNLINANDNSHQSRKLIYRQKIVIHYKQINKISIRNDLKTGIVSGEDGLISIIDLQHYKVIRIIKLNYPVLNTVALSYPYYMLFILCRQNKQFCYTINGQCLQQAGQQFIHEQMKICAINNYIQRVVIKKKNQLYFSLLKLPQISEQTKIVIKQQDNQILKFEATICQNDIQIVFCTNNNLIYCSNSLIKQKSKRNYRQIKQN